MVIGGDPQRNIVGDHETIVAQVMGVVKWGAEAKIKGNAQGKKAFAYQDNL